MTYEITFRTVNNPHLESVKVDEKREISDLGPQIEDFTWLILSPHRGRIRVVNVISCFASDSESSKRAEQTANSKRIDESIASDLSKPL